VVKPTRAKRKPPARKLQTTLPPDFDDILLRFSEARSFLDCAARLLDDWDPDADKGPGDEAVCLRHGLTLIRAVYNDLDTAILALGDRPAR